MLTHEAPQFTETLLMDAARQTREGLLEFQPSAYHLALSVLRNAADAEDVVQEAYFRAVGAEASVPADRTTARKWFLVIVLNTARTALKLRARRLERQRRSQAIAVRTSVTPVDEAERAEVRQALNSALDELDEHYRLPIALHYEQGLSYPDAAEILDLPVSTVSVYASRGVAQLRDRLQSAGFAVTDAALLAALAGMGNTGVPTTAATAIKAMLYSGAKPAAHGAGKAGILAANAKLVAICVGALCLLAALQLAPLKPQPPRFNGNEGPAALAPAEAWGGNARFFEQTAPTLKTAVRYFCEPVVAPGDVCRIAFSKRAYEAAANAVFDYSKFTFQCRWASETLSGTVQPPARSVSPATVEHVARELKAEPADLVWLELPAPARAFRGPVSLELRSAAWGVTKRSFLVADFAAPVLLSPHRLRTVFSDQERAPYFILTRPGFPGGDATVWCQEAPPSKPLKLGTLTLASNSGPTCDSRGFTLQTAAVPPGTYQLWVETPAGASAKIPFEVVAWTRRSPLLVQTNTSCLGVLPRDNSELQRLHEAGVECAISGGYSGMLTTEMPELNGEWQTWLKNENPALPLEYAQQRTSNDVLLENYLRNQIALVDFYARGENFYNEGLSYYHSYKPSVDRMVRRLQIFAQQTTEYPSFAGMSYGWYPSLWGYASGGVDTDAHKLLRSQALDENVARAGFTPLSDAERAWYQQHKFDADADTHAKALALMERGIGVWRAQMELGFGAHNALYNRAVRQARPGTQCLICENAGNDTRIRTRSLFNDMEAVAYESYSSYPEWPLSAAFNTDWARGNFPNRPVWLTIDPSSTDEGKMKSLFHAFARGISGGGVVFVDGEKADRVTKLGKGLRFVSQYGAIPLHAQPDRRFAILVTAAEQAFSSGLTDFQYHAMYYHLTRLGCAPVFVADEDVAAGGVPAGTRVLFVVRQTNPLEAKVADALQAFIARGGKVILTGDSRVEIPRALMVDAKIKTLFDLGGFQAHLPMRMEFEQTWRRPLEDALGRVGVAPAARTDPDQAIVATLDAGPVRYAVVIEDHRTQEFYKFEPDEHVPVSLEGSGWIVRDLVKQTTLPARAVDGRTLVDVALVTEPCTLLALYKNAPKQIAVRIPPDPQLGHACTVSCAVNDEHGASLGAVPVAYTLTDPHGVQRLSVFRAAGDELQIPLPALATEGKWKLAVQELLTGVTAAAEFDVRAPEPASAITPLPDVHTVDAAQIEQFLKRAPEKVIVVEAGQAELLPVAQKLAAGLNAHGVKARVWQVGPADLVEIPLRWFPTEAETKELDEIAAGRKIGVRKNLTPFIDRERRIHIPEKGGYAEIGPAYMMGTDCIVFSGGKLAESLRSVTAWCATPDVPGRGQGRLVVCFSPFSANADALAIIGNDREGLERAAREVEALAK